MVGSHDPRLVLLSVLVAVFASYTALDLAGRVAAAGARARAGWLGAGSFAMGVGIWSMHFIGMLAFRLPVPIRYDVTLWLASVAVAVGASLLALVAVSRSRVTPRLLLAAGVIMGMAIAGMHYTGMAAMRIPARIGYAPGLVAASLAIAVAAAYAALWLAFRLRRDTPDQLPLKLASAVVMGLAIAGMHYTAMAAVRIGPAAPAAHHGASLLANETLAAWVAGGTLAVLVLALMAAAVDRGVSQRMEQLAEMRRSDERFRSLVSGLPAIFYQAEPRPPYETIYVSPGVALLGYTVEEWRARPESWLRAIHPDDRDWVLQRTQAALEAGARTDLQYRVVARDGAVRWMHDQGGFVRDEAGEPLYWQGVMLDVTDRTLAQAERADQRTQLRQIIDVVPHGLFVKDEESRFILVNRTFARLFGMEPEQLEGQLEADVLRDPELAAFFRESDLEVMRSGTPYFHPDSRFVTPDGEALVTETIKVPFRRAGSDRLAVLGLTRDMTAERSREDQLRRAQRLASVGTLLGGVAHELNNPLAAIKGFASLLLMDERSGEDREALETVRREADRAAKIVSDLRVLARGTQVEPGTRRDPVDLADVVRHILKLRAYSLETRNLTVRRELDPSLPAVLADRAKLEQVVLNLVVNAEQALAAGTGEPCITIRAHSVGDQVQLTVADNGPGIAPEHLDRIFDPFFTTKAPGEGTGLGLSLVHTIVQEHGGSMEVDSEPGRGAAFRVTLPVAPRLLGQREEVPRGPASAPRPLRILVVDDEEPVRRTLVRFLTRRGHRVDQAAEGGEALDRVRAALSEEGYDVILSDLRMPGLGGAELLERLRREGNGASGRLIFVTGDAASSDSADLLARLGAPVLTKPFDLDQVAALVEQRAEHADRRTTS